MKRINILVFMIFGTFIFMANGCSQNNENSGGNKKLAKESLIKTEKPQRKNFQNVCHWFGKVGSKNKTQIISLESGVILSINAKDGVTIVKGQPVFDIGGPLINSRQTVLSNKLISLQKRIAFAEKMVSLKKDAISQKFANFSELASAEDSLAQLKTEFDAATQEKLQLENAIQMRATIGGTFAGRKVCIGQEVQKGDTLAEIISKDQLYIIATIFPKDNDINLQNKNVVINLPNNKSIKGIVINVMPRKNAEGANVIWIESDELIKNLQPGQTIAGTLILSEHRNTLAVPENAIMRDEEEKAFVFIKTPDGYKKRLVKTGIEKAGWIEIKTGIEKDDKIVIKGAYELFYQDFNKIYKVVD